MLKRIWHGWAPPANAEDYEDLLTNEIVPGILSRRIPGLRGIEILRISGGGDADVEFVTIMSFDDWDSVREFAGDDSSSVVPRSAQILLSRFDKRSKHYETVKHFDALR